MRLCITGTPGTGKTRTAAELAALLDWPCKEANELAAAHVTAQDPEREATVVETAALDSVRLPDPCVVEGHLSQYFSCDIAVVLRCRPDVLRERLEERDWPEAKVEENIRSEVLDAVLQDTINECYDVVELDTTDSTPEETAETIAAMTEDEDLRDEHRPGGISWSFEYLED